MGPEDRPFHRVYVREHASFRFAPDGILAPDLALGLIPETLPRARKPLGIFIRKDLEAHETVPWYSEDPVELALSPEQYMRLASRYKVIITNRLHFAVAGVLLDRKTIILPNSYHKNFSMYETWLSDLGCDFAPSLDAALQQINRETLSWFFQARHYLSSAIQRYRTDQRRAA
jgi:hypothetical protein